MKSLGEGIKTFIHAYRESFKVEQRRSEQAQRLLPARLRMLSLQGRLLAALGLGPPAP